MAKKRFAYRYLNLPHSLLAKVQKHIDTREEYENVIEFILESVEEKIRLDILVDYNEKTSNSDYGDDECLPSNDKHFPGIFPAETFGYVS